MGFCKFRYEQNLHEEMIQRDSVFSSAFETIQDDTLKSIHESKYYSKAFEIANLRHGQRLTISDHLVLPMRTMAIYWIE